MDKIIGTIVGTTATVSGLGNGDYQVQVSDKSLCTAKQRQLYLPDPLKVSLVSKQDVLLTGHATGSYHNACRRRYFSLLLFLDRGLVLIRQRLLSWNQTDLLAGNYYLTVDSLGCKRIR